MATPPRNSPNTAAEKLRRAQEASQIMKDLETERAATRAKTERLRAERLAREAANPAPPKKKRPGAKTT